MLAVDAEAIRFAGTVAVNNVELLKAVDNAVPFHRTVEPLTNPVPLTTRVRLVEFKFKDMMTGIDCALTINCTGTAIGLLEACAELMEIVPLYVPTGRLAGLAETDKVTCVVPPLGLTDSHAPPEVVEAAAEIVKGDPLLVTMTEAAEGKAPPCW